MKKNYLLSLTKAQLREKATTLKIEGKIEKMVKLNLVDKLALFSYSQLKAA